jgi:hypothetical protein
MVLIDLALARDAREFEERSMTKFLLALLAMASIAAGVANAAQPRQQASVTGGYDYGTEGGGG